MRRSSRPDLASARPAAAPSSTEAEAVNLIEDLTRAIQSTLEERDRAVNAARAAGASWPKIARAAGISHQAAHQKWAGRQSGECGREKDRVIVED